MKIIYNSLILALATITPLAAFQMVDRGFQEHKIFGEIGFDYLRVKDIIIGIEPYEREQTQDLLIDMRVSLDIQAVSEADLLDYTVDYVRLAELATELATVGKYCFIDVLGIDILKKVFEAYPEIEKGSITIRKEAAIPQAKSGGLVEISVTRDDLFNPKTQTQWIGMIGYDQLLVHTVIGDLPEERENQQDLLVDARVKIDLKAIVETGELNSTVSYVEMAKLFEEVANNGQYQMIETLALMYIKRLYIEFPQIEEAYVLIRKPGTLPGYPFKNDAVASIRL